MFSKLLAAVAAITSIPAIAHDDAPSTEPVQVMILGTYHFANPGQDVVNMDVDDVLAPRRQQEIILLTNALARWSPTKIAVENQAEAPSLEMADYAQTEELLRTSRNESIQIGYRLASKLGHRAVYGYDEQSGEGEPDYFPLDAVRSFADENGQSQLVDDIFAEVQTVVEAEQAKLPMLSIAASLMAHNDPVLNQSRNDRWNYAMLTIGDGDAQPGAELNAYWYMRNAKMFAKIALIAEPGDRIIAIAGSGHASWLYHFVEHTPGFELVDPMPYLQAAEIMLETAE